MVSTILGKQVIPTTNGFQGVTKMKINDVIARDRRSLSFEFFPPKTPDDERQLFDTVGKLETLNPSFVSVTYGAGGSTSANTRRVVQRLKDETKLTVMPHLTCVGQTAEDLERILREYRDLGIENVLALRGDPPKEGAGAGEAPKCHAIDLVRLAHKVGGFSVGVAVYPEGHCESSSLEDDMAYTKEKIEAGADFAITQMFFDNMYYYRFIERAVKARIRIPIIPGIMPVTDIKKIRRFAEMCAATLPARYYERFEKATSPEEARKIGVELATEQSADLLRHGVPYLHFYTLNRPETVTEIVRNLNLGTNSPEMAAAR